MEWCDEAARILRAIRPHAIVTVAVAQLFEGGAISHLEAVGAAGQDAQGSTVQGEALMPLHASSLDWWVPQNPAAPERPRAAMLREVAGFDRFIAGDAGRRWNRVGGTDFLVGLAPMPGHVLGRTLIVQMAVNAGGRKFEASDASVLSAVLVALVSRASLAFGEDVTSPMNRLTHREREVLDHLALGKSVKEIASDLARSPHTVHDHVKSLHRKLNASSRGELIARALGHISSCGRSEGGRAVRVSMRIPEFSSQPDVLTRALASA
jgi:DNA-binding CsgD family transcriptional regulator